MKIFYIFTFNYSLQTWKDSGSLAREITFFNKLIKDFDCEITLLTYGDKNDFKYIKDLEKINVIPMFSNFRKPKSKLALILYSFIFPIYLIIKKEYSDFDIIKFNQLSGCWVGILLKIFTRKPLYIRTGYDTYLFSIKENKNLLKRYSFFLLTKLALIFSNLYSVSSLSDYKYLTQNNKYVKRKIVLRPNWVLYDNKFNEVIEKDSETIFSVGRLESQKNYIYLVDEFKNYKFKIRLIGSGSEKKLLTDKANSYNLDFQIIENMDFFQLQKFYKLYKFFILPSFFEGNPKVLLEAMANGCIVFASNIDNHREIIEHGINGFLFNLESNNLLNLFNSVSKNELLCNKVSSNAQNTIKNNYSLDKITNSYYEDFSKLTK